MLPVGPACRGPSPGPPGVCLALPLPRRRQLRPGLAYGWLSGLSFVSSGRGREGGFWTHTSLNSSCCSWGISDEWLSGRFTC